MNNFTRQHGATLIEVAITGLILATSLLAMATLQTRSLQFNKSSVMRSQANIYAYDIIDRIRINRGASSGNIEAYNAEYTGTPSGNTLATSDVAAWRSNLTSLPEGAGKIVCNKTTRLCTVSIKWSEEFLFGTQSSSNPDASSELVYSTSI